MADVVEARIGLFEHPGAAAQIYDIGGTEEVSINELVRRFKTGTNSDSPIITIPYSDIYSSSFEDMKRRVPDTSKIRQLVDWQSRQSLDDILQDVI